MTTVVAVAVALGLAAAAAVEHPLPLLLLLLLLHLSRIISIGVVLLARWGRVLKLLEIYPEKSLQVLPWHLVHQSVPFWAQKLVHREPFWEHLVGLRPRVYLSN